MHRRRSWKSWRSLAAVAATATGLSVLPWVAPPAAQAYAPTGGVMYELGGNACLKGRGNCAIYPKATQLPSGRLVAAFELSTVVPGSPGTAGQTMPIYTSDDDGASWQARAQVPAPATATGGGAGFARWTSNWTNPDLYVLPQDVGALRAGTLLLASVVSGEDQYYRERKAADPSWVPSNDGDRQDLAIALYASTDEGASWTFQNIVATGGWQGGSAGAVGQNVSAANSTRQVDPLWEPHLMVHQGQLVAFYSDENDYTGFDPTTGVPTLAADNATGPDTGAQILVHRTWDGRTSWSQPVVDVPGTSFTQNGAPRIGGGRPGMTTIAPTIDGRWMLTFEYFGGGSDVRYKVSADPLRFFAAGDADGDEITGLPVDAGSGPLARGGSPVVEALPDGRLIYNAAGSGDIWVNDSGRSDGVWTEHRTPLGAGYSRTMQYDRTTGRVVILQGVWGGASAGSTIRFGEVDLGDSAGAYHQLVNRRTGQVLGTSGNTNDADMGNGGQPDVRSEAAGSAADPDTQLWHVLVEGDGTVTLLNKSGGREAAVWTGSATAGQRIGQWVDDRAGGTWRMTATSDDYYRFSSVADTGLALTAGSAGAPATLQATATDGSQEWRLVAVTTRPTQLVNGTSRLCLDDYQFGTANGAEVRQWACSGGANQRWTVQPVADGWSTVVNQHSGLCLDDYQFGTANGAEVRQWACSGGTNQQWRLVPAGDGVVTVVNRYSGLCLDDYQFGTANGAAVRQWACNGQPNQLWHVG